MPHLEEQFPPVNPLVLQRPDALQPPNRQEDREEDEEARPVGTRAEDEAPLPGTLANGIDRVTISNNARGIQPVQPGEETVPVPAELIPGENEVNPEVPELLTEETRQRNVGALDTDAVETPRGNGLQNFNDELETNRGDNEPPEPVPNTIEPQPGRNRITPTRNAEVEPDPRPEAEFQNRVAPETPPPRGPALAGQTEPRNLVFEEIPQRQETQGLRGTTPLPRTEGRVNIETPPAEQVDTQFPNVQEARNFGQGRVLTLDQASSGNEDAPIAVDSVDEALAEGGAIPGPETGEIRQPELLIAPAVQPGFVPESEPFEEPVPETQNRFTLDGTLPAEEEPIAPPEEPIQIQPELAEEDPEPPIPDPRQFDAGREPVIAPAPEAEIEPVVIEPGPEPETPEPAASSLTDTRQVFEEDQETQQLQPPAFPELDNDEPFVPQPEPEPREEDIPAVAQAPAPAPAVDDAPPVAEPEPGNIEALNENPASLRRNNLGTDPALRSNRAIRSFLETFNERIEPPEEVTEPEGAPIAEVQNNAPPPPRVFENLEALSAELLNSLREQQAAEEGVTRPEEERTAPPPVRTPERLLTERGLNIDRFV